MLTIAWDIDDVLNELMKEWFEKGWNVKHPECKLDYEDLTKNPPHELLGVKKEEYLASLDEFRLNNFSALKPIPEVMDWFLKYGDKCRHIALTSTPLTTAPLSAEWVIRNYGKWIRTFHFIPSPRDGIIIPEYDKTKGEYLAHNKADIIVEDSEENIISAEKAGVKGVLFARPWNSGKNSIEETLYEISNKIF